MREFLGRGASGAVYACERVDPSAAEGPPTLLAIKFLVPSDASMRSAAAEEEHRRRALRMFWEYRVGRRLRHPHCLAAYDMGSFVDELGRPVFYIVVDRCSGGDLHRLVAEHRRGLPPVVACALSIQLLRGLDAIHSLATLHNDLKPGNVLLERPIQVAPSVHAARDLSGAPTLRIGDYGSADLLDSSALARSNAMGTPAYYPPERWMGLPGDPRSDLYSAGLVIGELFTGLHLLSHGVGIGTTVRDWRKMHLENVAVPLAVVAPELPRDVADAVSAMLEKSPRNRPRTAAVVLDVLLPALEREIERAGDERDSVTSHPLPRCPPERSPPYLATPEPVGRVRELEAAAGLVDACFAERSVDEGAERPLAVMIGGPPGSGKSHFLGRFLRDAQARHHAVIAVCQGKTDYTTAFEALRPLVRALEAGEESVAPDAAPDTRRGSSSPARDARPTVTALATRPHDAGETIPDPSEPLGDVLASGESSAIVSGREREDRVLRAITELLCSVGTKRPVVIAIEDLQWLDGTSVRWLVQALDTIEERRRGLHVPIRVFFAFAHRPQRTDPSSATTASSMESYLQRPPVVVVEDELERRGRERSLALTMGPLGIRECERMISGMLVEPEERVSALARSLFADRSEAADGEGLEVTPLYVQQIMQLLLHRGALTEGRRDANGRWSGRWNLELSRAGVPLPRAAIGVVAERATHLRAQTRDFLSHAAAYGREIDMRVVATSLGLEAFDVLDCIDEATTSGFVEVDFEATRSGDHASWDRELEHFALRPHRFTHDRYREALLASTAREELPTIHLRLAIAMSRVHGSSDATAASLSKHYHHAGRSAEAFLYGVRAGDSSARSGDYGDAKISYEIALAAGERLGLEINGPSLELLGQTYIAHAMPNEARAAFERRLSEQEGEARLPMLRELAELAYQFESGVACAGPLEALADGLGHVVPYQASFRWIRALVGFVQLLRAARSYRDVETLITPGDAYPVREVEKLYVYSRLGEAISAIDPIKILFICMSMGHEIGKRAPAWIKEHSYTGAAIVMTMLGMRTAGAKLHRGAQIAAALHTNTDPALLDLRASLSLYFRGRGNLTVEEAGTFARMARRIERIPEPLTSLLQAGLVGTTLLEFGYVRGAERLLRAYDTASRRLAAVPHPAHRTFGVLRPTRQTAENLLALVAYWRQREHPQSEMGVLGLLEWTLAAERPPWADEVRAELERMGVPDSLERASSLIAVGSLGQDIQLVLGAMACRANPTKPRRRQLNRTLMRWKFLASGNASAAPLWSAAAAVAALIDGGHRDAPRHEAVTIAEGLFDDAYQRARAGGTPVLAWWVDQAAAINLPAGSEAQRRHERRAKRQSDLIEAAPAIEDAELDAGRVGAPVDWADPS